MDFTPPPGRKKKASNHWPYTLAIYIGSVTEVKISHGIGHIRYNSKWYKNCNIMSCGVIVHPNHNYLQMIWN